MKIKLCTPISIKIYNCKTKRPAHTRVTVTQKSERFAHSNSVPCLCMYES